MNAHKTMIQSRMISGFSGPLIERLIGWLFRAVEVDRESHERIIESMTKGPIVYASFLESGFSRVLFHVLLKKAGFDAPDDNPRSLINGNSVHISLARNSECIRGCAGATSDPLVQIIKIQRVIETPVQLLPQMVFWNRNPEWTKGKPLFDSDATADRGFISAWFTITKSIRHSFIRILAPLNLRAEIDCMPGHTDEAIAGHIREKCYSMRYGEKRIVLGVVRRSHREMMDLVVNHESITSVIRSLVRVGVPEKKLQAQAARYFKEISTDQSVVIIRIMETVIRFIFKRVFGAIRHSRENIPLLKEALSRGPVLILPTHKSHTDYMLLSFVLFFERIMPPVICAGSNLAFFPLSILFRGVGAFFMRRSFKGQELYTAVFKRYVTLLAAEGPGASIEVFIEGGRSRTGKAVYPRSGFLNIIIDAVREGHVDDVSILPVSITYERVIEEISYHNELRSGEKKGESASVIIKSIKFLKRNHGDVHIAFGRPFSLVKSLSHDVSCADTGMALAYTAIEQINEIIAITPTALVSAALLLSPLQGFTLSSVSIAAGRLLDYCKKCGIRTVETLGERQNLNRLILAVVQNFQDEQIINDGRGKLFHSTADDTSVWIIPAENRPRIAFCKNVVLHHFIPHAYVALSLLFCRRGDLAVEMNAIRESFVTIQKLFSREFLFTISPERIRREIGRSLEYFGSAGAIFFEKDTIKIATGQTAEIIFFARLIQEYVESYYVVFESLADMPEAGQSQEDIIAGVRQHALDRYHARKIRLAESLSLAHYKEAVQFLLAQKIVGRTRDNRSCPQLYMINTEQAAFFRARLCEYLHCLGGGTIPEKNHF